MFNHLIAKHMAQRGIVHLHGLKAKSNYFPRANDFWIIIHKLLPTKAYHSIANLLGNKIKTVYVKYYTF